MLRNFEHRKEKIQIIVDFNINLKNEDNDPSREFSDILQGYNLRFAIKKPTRITNNNS